MNRRNRDFPGIGNKPETDRHGKKRWRLRRTIKGRKIDTYIYETYGSAAFRAAYDAAIDVSAPKVALKAAPGTFDYVITEYLGSSLWKDASPETKKGKRKRLDWIRSSLGAFRLSGLEPKHIVYLMGNKGGPNAANRLLKEISEIFTYATKHHGYNGPNPAAKVDPRPIKTTGHHTWTQNEIDQFRERHPSGTTARLALELMIGTGAARQDICAMGRLNIKAGRIEYTRHKTGEPGSYSLEKIPALFAEIRLSNAETLFFTHDGSKPYSVGGFGNWFRNQCKEAALPARCSIHRVRKYAATRLAENGATEFQIMAFLAHKTPDEARTYVQAASRKTLNDSAADLLLAEELPNHTQRLGKTPPQPLEKKAK